MIYQGDQTQTRVPAGVERSVSYTRSGTDVFARVVRVEGGSAESVAFFDAIDDMTEAVESSDTSGIQRGIREVDDMQFNVSLAIAQTGSDQAVVRAQMDVLEETALRLKSTLSDIEDLNYAEAVTRMNKEQLALEAAMGSFAKISGLSLFDYIRGG